MNVAALAIVGLLALGPATPSVTIAPSRSTVAVGDSLTVTTTVTNDSDAPLTGRIAHLNVLSTDPSTYVDPEDWSDQRTQFLPVIPAHGSLTQHWDVKAVNHGSFLVYVVVSDPASDAPLAASPPVHLGVTAHTTLDPGGSLVAVLGIPAAMGGLVLAQQLARRRRR